MITVTLLKEPVPFRPFSITINTEEDRKMFGRMLMHYTSAAKNAFPGSTVGKDYQNLQGLMEEYFL